MRTVTLSRALILEVLLLLLPFLSVSPGRLSKITTTLSRSFRRNSNDPSAL